MRQKHNIQPKLRGSFSGHQLADEMLAMAQILESHGCICDAVMQDLTRSVDDKTGAPGMDAMSVIKAAVLQKLMGVSYERLAFHLIDSRCCRDFRHFSGESVGLLGLGSVLFGNGRFLKPRQPLGYIQAQTGQDKQHQRHILPGADRPGVENPSNAGPHEKPAGFAFILNNHRQDAAVA